MTARAVVLLFALLLAACSPDPDADPQELRSLAQESRALLAIPYGGDQGPVRALELGSSNWPPSIVMLKPERVALASDGIYVQTWSSFVESAGYFIPRDAAHFRAEGHGDPLYRALSHGVYWYEVKG